MKIKIYTRSNCHLCVSAKQLLTVKGIPYDEFNAENEHIRADLEHNHPQVRQMPAIWVDGQYVGGFAGLQAALKKMGV